MKNIAFTVVATLIAATVGAQTPAAGGCAGSRDLRLVNGKIATMDARNSVVSEVTIQDGVFTAVGKSSGRLSPCTQVINLGGRTVEIIATPGHTPGHMAFLFDGGWCLTGDVAFHDPLSYSFPEARSVYDTDRDQGVRTRLRLLERLVADRLSIIGYHHPWPGIGRLERTVKH